MADLFTKDEKALLGELINMSFGLAASLIGDMLNSYVDLKIPRLEVLKGEEFEKFINAQLEKDKQFYVSKQNFSSDFNGETVFVISDVAAKDLTALMHRNLDIPSENLSDNDILNAILETTNIITSSCIGQLNEFLKFEVIFTPPSLALRESSYIAKYNENLEYDNVIVIETALDLQEEEIKGYLFILTDERFATSLRTAMENMGEQGFFG